MFDRIGKRITLTQAGVVLLKHTKQVMQTIKSAQDELDDLKHLYTGTLNVGMLSGDLDFRLTNIVIEFHREFPDIKLTLQGSVNIRQMVLQNQADIGLTVLGHEDDRIIQIPLIHETFGIVTSERHSLADRIEFPFVDLHKLPLILFPKGFVGRDLIDSHSDEKGIRLEPIIETSTVPSIINMVRNDLGVSVFSRQLIESIGGNDLRFIPLVDPTPFRDIGIIYRSDRYISHAARSFVNKLISRLKHLR